MLAVSSTLGLRCQGLSPALLQLQVTIPLKSVDGLRCHNVSWAAFFYESYMHNAHALESNHES